MTFSNKIMLYLHVCHLINCFTITCICRFLLYICFMSQLANNTKRTCILTNLLSASNQNFLSASNLYLFARDFSFTFPFFTVLTFVTKIRKAIDVVIFYYFKVVCGICHFISCFFICAIVFVRRPYDFFVQ